MTFTTPPDGSIIFTSVQLAEHDRQVRETVVREVQEIVDDCVPRGQYERFDDRLLHRRLRDLASNVVPTRDEHGADPSRAERDRRHEVEAAILEVLVLLDATQEREGPSQDEPNRLEAMGMLFEIFERLSSRAGGSDG